MAKFILSLLLFIIGLHYNLYAQLTTPLEVVQKQLETYNDRDIDGFMALFSDDVKLYNQTDHELLAQDKIKVRKMYTHLFDESPQLRSELTNRMVLGNTVIDHEYITGRMGNPDPIELIVIYELKDLKIVKVTVIR